MSFLLSLLLPVLSLTVLHTTTCCLSPTAATFLELSTRWAFPFRCKVEKNKQPLQNKQKGNCECSSWAFFKGETKLLCRHKLETHGLQSWALSWVLHSSTSINCSVRFSCFYHSYFNPFHTVVLINRIQKCHSSSFNNHKWLFRKSAFRNNIFIKDVLQNIMSSRLKTIVKKLRLNSLNILHINDCPSI